MVYKCYKCKFLFSRIQTPTQCPDCGAEYIVAANEEERQEYEQLKKEFRNNEKSREE